MGANLKTDSKLFAISLGKITGKEVSHDIVLRHVDHLKQLHKAGQLVLCGRFSDHPSALVVIRAKDKDAAEAIAKCDPLVLEGAPFEVRTWIIANEENNYLI